MKKYPRGWLNMMGLITKEAYLMGKDGIHFPNIGLAEGDLYLTDLLSKMEKAGMLSEPLKTELCKIHMSQRSNRNRLICKEGLSFEEPACTFVKVIEVEE